jgi:acyl carrier protein
MQREQAGQREQVLELLRTYVLDEVLYGRDIGLGPETPLLEWGIINSMQIIRMLSFVQRKLNVIIPPEQVVGENFQDLESITRLVLSSASSESSPVSPVPPPPETVS